MTITRRTILLNSGTVLPGVVVAHDAVDESPRGLQEEFKRGCDLGREIGARRSSRQ